MPVMSCSSNNTKADFSGHVIITTIITQVRSMSVNSDADLTKVKLFVNYILILSISSNLFTLEDEGIERMEWLANGAIWVQLSICGINWEYLGSTENMWDQLNRSVYSRVDDLTDITCSPVLFLLCDVIITNVVLWPKTRWSVKISFPTVAMVVSSLVMEAFDQCFSWKHGRQCHNKAFKTFCTQWGIDVLRY